MRCLDICLDSLPKSASDRIFVQFLQDPIVRRVEFPKELLNFRAIERVHVWHYCKINTTWLCRDRHCSRKMKRSSTRLLVAIIRHGEDNIAPMRVEPFRSERIAPHYARRLAAKAITPCERRVNEISLNDALKVPAITHLSRLNIIAVNIR